MHLWTANHSCLASITLNYIVFSYCASFYSQETSIELVNVADDGNVQSLCEQAVFGTIKDLAILPWNENIDTQNPQVYWFACL